MAADCRNSTLLAMFIPDLMKECKQCAGAFHVSCFPPRGVCDTCHCDSPPAPLGQPVPGRVILDPPVVNSLTAPATEVVNSLTAPAMEGSWVVDAVMAVPETFEKDNMECLLAAAMAPSQELTLPQEDF